MKNFIATKFLSRNYLWIEIKNDRSLSKIIELINKISCIREKGRIIEKTHIKYVFLIVYNLFFLKWLKFELNIYIKKRSEFYILEKEGITVMREKEENVDAISIISIRKRRISNVPSTNKSFNRLNGYCSNPYYLESRFKGDRNRANFYTVS